MAVAQIMERQDALFEVEVVVIELPRPAKRVRRTCAKATTDLLASRPIPELPIETMERLWRELEPKLRDAARDFASGDEHVAEDFLSEARLRVLRTWHHVVVPQKVERWLLKASISAMRDLRKFLRRQKRRAVVLSLNEVIDDGEETELMDMIPAREAPEGIDHLGLPDHLIVVAEALSQGMDGAEIRHRYRMSLARFNAIKKEIRAHLENQNASF